MRYIPAMFRTAEIYIPKEYYIPDGRIRISHYIPLRKTDSRSQIQTWYSISLLYSACISHAQSGYTVSRLYPCGIYYIQTIFLLQNISSNVSFTGAGEWKCIPRYILNYIPGIHYIGGYIPTISFWYSVSRSVFHYILKDTPRDTMGYTWDTRGKQWEQWDTVGYSWDTTGIQLGYSWDIYSDNNLAVFR